jgi:transposase
LGQEINFCSDSGNDGQKIRDLVQLYYSHTGAPSVDHIVVFKMALLGYLYGIISKRKLAENAA